MEKQQHTPGPWKFCTDDLCLGDIHGTRGETVARTNLFDWEDSVEGYANARRIVAAINACDGIPTDTLTPGSIKALIDACGKLLATINNDRTPLNVSELSAVYRVRDALAPFRGTQEVKPDVV